MRTFRRLFVLAPDCHTSTRFESVWRRHFYEGIRAVVPEAVLPASIDWAWARPPTTAPRGDSPQRTRVSEELWRQIRSAADAGGLDAVVSYCFGTDVDPGLVERTVERGIPWVNFYCDSVYAFDLVEDVARVASLNWFPEHGAVDRYRALGRPILCRPYAVHPDALPDVGGADVGGPEIGSPKPVHAAGFVGAANPRRVAILAALRLLGCRVAVRGSGWQRARERTPGAAQMRPRARLRRLRRDLRMDGRLSESVLARALAPLVRRGSRPLADGELVPFLSRCRVVLGLNEGRDERGRWLSYLKLRDVEFPGHGCCYLTQRNEDVEQAFEVGREVLAFGSVREAAALVRECARHPERARAIGRAGRRRVLAEHTWAVRLGELARAL
ncbi:MAG TPA: glycosyltransferase [Longimicrobiales bacterium]|nr:glycosyltransferase [Longimicrobiales bacterium]